MLKTEIQPGQLRAYHHQFDGTDAYGNALYRKCVYLVLQKTDNTLLDEWECLNPDDASIFTCRAAFIHYDELVS